LRQDRRFEAAAERLTGWVTDHPEDADARLLLGQVLAEGGRQEDAFGVWQGLLEELPADAERFRAVSTRLRDLGQLQRALDVLVWGARELDGDPFPWERAEVALRMGRFDDAVEAHLDLLRQEPNRRPLVESRIASIAAAELEAGLLDGGRAQRYCDAVAEALSRSEPAERIALTLILAGSRLEVGEPRRGLQALQTAIESDEVLQAVFTFASRCEERGHADEAAAAYALYAAHGGDSPYRYRSMLKQAEMVESLGDIQAAIDLYAGLAAANPRRSESVEALLRVARLQGLVLGDADLALQTLSTLEGRTRSGGMRRRLLSLRTECYVRLDDLAAARRQLEALSADVDGAIEATFGLARLAFYEGDYAAAVSFIDSLVTRSTSHPLANDALDLLLLIEEFKTQPTALGRLGQARLRQRQGRGAEARAHWQWLLSHAPPALRQVARLERARQLEADDLAQALALYSLALTEAEADSRHAVSAHLGRARVLEAQGQADGALRSCEQALLAAPHDARAPEIRRQIERLRGERGTIDG
jgi:tetratricopeptide (TPR) repeat protein